MKHILILQIILLICIQGNAQPGMVVMHKPQDLEMFMKSSKDFQELQGENSEVKGSPYLSDEFESSLVHLNNTWYEDVALKYDIYNDHFEAEFTSGKMIIDPIRNSIDTIHYNGEVFVRKIIGPLKNMDVSYMVLLGQWNNFSLYKQYKTRLNPATPTDGYNEAKPAEFHGTSPGYYIFNKDEMMEIKGTKSIAEAFNAEVKTVKRYFKDNGYKISVEQDLISAAAHFSGLNAELK